VEIYSRGEAVRLYLDDKPIAEKPTTRAEKFKANFSVPYAPGVLKAVAIQGGKPIAESILKTAGEPMQIRLTADRKLLRADGQDLSFITWKLSTPTGSQIRMRIIWSLLVSRGRESLPP
jgi:beta-galactosidase